ncbi:MAG TPA: haloacid dehalogenase-like hydrolase, partial [Chitinophagales bacterium]|nr:haloacid dehalogenase-like hydrolase [Chitinophagales bacterium]
CSIWLEAWCKKENIEMFCSELEVLNGKFTGKLKGENCYGPEKANRLNAGYDLSKIRHVVAFGNHRSDYYYMDLAHEAYLVKGNQITKHEKQR